MTRKSGKKLQLRMSADAATAPVVGDVVAHITGLQPTSRAQHSVVTAAGDQGAAKAGGIPDANVRVSGRLLLGQSDPFVDPMLAAHNDQVHRQFHLIWDDDFDTEYLSFVALVSQYGANGQHAGPIDFSATLEVEGLLNDNRPA